MEYIIVIIVFIHKSCFTLKFIGALVGFWIHRFLLKYRVKKLTVITDIKTYMYDVINYNYLNFINLLPINPTNIILTIQLKFL